MAPPDPLSRPSRLATAFGPPGDPRAAGWRPGGPPGALGPSGVWPPPGPEGASRRRAGPGVRAGDDLGDTQPLLLTSGLAETGLTETGQAEGPPRGAAGRGWAARLRRLVPHAWRDVRIHPGRPGATALVLVAAGAAVIAAIGVWTELPHAEPVAGLPAVGVVAEPTPEPTVSAGSEPAAGSMAASTAAAPTPPAGPLVVSVSGKVHRPGLVEVPSGARVADVLDAAGGALPGTDLAGLNLARRVTDGEQVAVGVPPAPDATPDATYAGPVGPGSPAAGPAAPAGKVDLNVATAAQLDALPGVGPVMAARILEWRARNGRFSRVEQLREIEGIGERRFGQLRELVTV